MAKMKLTIRSINDIEPGERDVIVWDSEIPGFGLKVTPRGKRSFLLFYRTSDHTQRKPVIGSYPAIKPEIARGIAQDWLAQVRAGGDPSAERKAGRAGRGQDTVAQMVAEYLNAKSDKRSIGEVERIFRKDILPSIGSMNVESVKRSDITQLLEKIRKRAPVVARQARAHLSSFYTWAMPKLSDTAVNPVVGSVRIPAPPARNRVLSEDEIKCFWAALETLPPKWRTALKMLMLTGQRRSEVLNADWHEINLGKAEWVIPAERAKNEKAHIVPLAPAVLELLDTIPHRTGRIFPGMSKVSRTVKSIHAKMDASFSNPIEPWVWHDIRRTVATGMQRLGVKFEVTEAILNHVSGSRSGVAGVYQRYDWAEEKKDAVERWSQEVARIVSR